ncbi:hypothetical protein [Azospirillum sp. Marseille-Q6669]
MPVIDITSRLQLCGADSTIQLHTFFSIGKALRKGADAAADRPNLPLLILRHHHGQPSKRADRLRCRPVNERHGAELRAARNGRGDAGVVSDWKRKLSSHVPNVRSPLRGVTSNRKGYFG